VQKESEIPYSQKAGLKIAAKAIFWGDFLSMHLICR